MQVAASLNGSDQQMLDHVRPTLTNACTSLWGGLCGLLLLLRSCILLLIVVVVVVPSAIVSTPSCIGTTLHTIRPAATRILNKDVG